MSQVIELGALWVGSVVDSALATRPVLVNRDPQPAETGIAPWTSIGVHIVDVGPDGIERSATRLWVDGVLAFEGGGSPEFKPGFDGPGSSCSDLPDTLLLVVDPTTDLDSQAVITVRVLTQTKISALVLDQSYQFTVADVDAPALLNARATDRLLVEIQYSELMSDSALVPSAYAILQQQDWLNPSVPLTVAVAVFGTDQSSVLLTTDVEQTPGASYLVTVAEDVTDEHGNPIAPGARTATFTGFVPQAPGARRFQLWEMIPRLNRRQDKTQDLLRFILCLQEVTDQLLADVDGYTKIHDPDRAPAAFLDAMLADMGNPFDLDLDLNRKRKLARILLDIYRQKGTEVGIVNAIRFFFGLEVTITSYNVTTMSLGESELGVDWILGPPITNLWNLFAFTIETEVTLTDEQRTEIRQLVEYMKPAHTHFVRFVEPGDPGYVDHWSLGDSELDLNTLLHL